MSKRTSKAAILRMISEMGFVSGAVKSEAESFMGINSAGTVCVSIRQSTANDLLAKLGQWQNVLGGLLEDGEPVEVEP